MNLSFPGSSPETMSTIINTHSSSTQYNRHFIQYLPPYNHHQQMIIENTNQSQQTTTTTNTPNLLSNHLNEEEHCQICGDLASGWHCG